MLTYPIQLEKDGGTVMASSPDFPELTTFGDDRDDTLAHAVDALEEAIAGRIHTGLDIPSPSKGEVQVGLPTLTAVKVILYQGMRDEGVGKAEMARRLGLASAAGRSRPGYPTSLADGPNGRRAGCHWPGATRERPGAEVAPETASLFPPVFTFDVAFGGYCGGRAVACG